MKHIAALILLAWWFAGIVVAGGFWSTALACVFPPWPMYLFIERIMQLGGLAG